MRSCHTRLGPLPPALHAQPVASVRACKQLRKHGLHTHQNSTVSKSTGNSASKRACKVAAVAPAAPNLEAPKEPVAPTPSNNESNGASEELRPELDSRPVASEGSASADGATSTSGQADTQESFGNFQALPSDGIQAQKPRQNRWNGNGANGSQQRRTHNHNRRRGPVQDFPYKVGDVVVGTVVGCTSGWRVALEYDKDVVGFCSPNNLPHVLRDSVAGPAFNKQVGLTREFRIDFIPEDLEYNGKGPLLSAREVDLDIIWKRAAQINEVCKQDRENIRALISKTNAGGLLGSFEGLPLFVPYSFIPRGRGSRQSKEEAAEQFVGKMTHVSIWETNRKNNKFVGNMVEAMNNRAYSSIKVGDLVWGEIGAVEGYGVFINLDDCPSVKALLHIGSISRAHVDATKDLFQVGERVHAVVCGVDLEKRRVNLSTAELEPEAGDMLFSKAKVYENAEKQVQDFRAFVAQRQKEIESGEFDDEEGDLDWN